MKNMEHIKQKKMKTLKTIELDRIDVELLIIQMECLTTVLLNVDGADATALEGILNMLENIWDRLEDKYTIEELDDWKPERRK